MQWSTKRYSIERKLPLPRNKVWDLLSNTDHLNRVIGLFPVKFNPVQSTDKLIFREADARFLGFIPVRWREYPFQWEKRKRYSVERRYKEGPLSIVIGGIELIDAEEKLPDGSYATRIRIFADFTPANLIGFIGAPLVGGISIYRTFKYAEKYLHNLMAGEIDAFPQTKYRQKANVSEISRLFKELAGKPVDPHYIGQLQNHLIQFDDDEVVEMQPNKLADMWGADKEEVLRICLYATKLGILNLSWNILCPNCRVSKSDHSSLANLKEEFHCDLCGVEYTANFDQYVELKFSVHPNIRKAYNQVYCIGGPFLTPHVWIQRTMEEGEEAIFHYPETSDPLRLRVLRSNHRFNLRKGDKIAPQSPSFTYRNSGWIHSEAELSHIGQAFTVRNEGSEPIVVVLEKVQWDTTAVTAAKVTAMQEFRDLFSSEVLAPGQQVGIENVTIFFSDLLGSTALYEMIGDAHAYGQVRRHFEFMTQWIAKNSGSLVKTIGDAVMAVFHLPEQAVKAALDIQTHLQELNATLPDPIIIKIGIHTGPAIAVTSNDRLDYFGRTVNIAARIQGESNGGDIVVSAECGERESVKAILGDHPVQLLAYQAALKGIDGQMELIRVNLPSENIKINHENIKINSKKAADRSSV